MLSRARRGHEPLAFVSTALLCMTARRSSIPVIADHKSTPASATRLISAASIPLGLAALHAVLWYWCNESEGVWTQAPGIDQSRLGGPMLWSQKTD